MKSNYLVCIFVLAIVSVAITANATISIAMAPSERSLVLEPQESKTITFTLAQNSGSDEIVQLFGPEWLEISQSRLILASGVQQAITVTVKPLDAGYYSGVLTAAATVSDGSAPVTVSAQISVTVTGGELTDTSGVGIANNGIGMTGFASFSTTEIQPLFIIVGVSIIAMIVIGLRLLHPKRAKHTKRRK